MGAGGEMRGEDCVSESGPSQGSGWELCPVLRRGRGWEGGRVDIRDREGANPGAHREGGRELVDRV